MLDTCWLVWSICCEMAVVGKGTATCSTASSTPQDRWSRTCIETSAALLHGLTSDSCTAALRYQ